jgi:hypothetical protein
MSQHCLFLNMTVCVSGFIKTAFELTTLEQE